MIAPPDERVEAARLTLQRNREQLRAAFTSEGVRAGFPRSATFRWLSSHLNPRALASTALTAVMLRPSLVQFLGQLILARRRRR